MFDALDELDETPTPDDDYGSRPVPGVGSLLLNQVEPRLYPINIYEKDDESASGLAGTLLPDGTFVPLPATGVRRHLERTGRYPETVYWDEVVARKVPGYIVWDGAVNGSIQHGVGKTPTRRMWDGSITGEWPNHPPRAERIVSPEKARYAAEYAAQEEAFWSSLQ
jgi:hypothetical protein